MRTILVDFDEKEGRPFGLQYLLNSATRRGRSAARIVATHFERLDGEVSQTNPGSLALLTVANPRAKLLDAIGDIANGKSTMQLASFDKVKQI